MGFIVNGIVEDENYVGDAGAKISTVTYALIVLNGNSKVIVLVVLAKEGHIIRRVQDLPI